jgi:uncharacterized protein YutE (UPF0331/DUF86 family)
MSSPAQLAVEHLLDALAFTIAAEGQRDPAEGVRLWHEVVRRGVVREGTAQVQAYQRRLVAAQGGEA